MGTTTSNGNGRLYGNATLGKGQGHPAATSAAVAKGLTPAEAAVAQVLAWAKANPANARAQGSATALAKAAGVNAYAGQYAYRQYLRGSGKRAVGSAWQAPQRAVAQPLAAKAAKAAAKGAKAAGKAAQPAPATPATPAAAPAPAPAPGA